MPANKPKVDKETGDRTYEFAAEADGSLRIVLSKHCYTECTNCHMLKPIQLRMMGDGTIRNQPQCSGCRGRYKKK